MAVFRIEKTRDYTVMSNYHLRDMSLSLKAKGLLSLMLSLPENWDYTMKGLARICKDGIDSISGVIRELEAHGYLIRARVRGANGQLGSIEYTILEQPKAPSPTQEKPIRESPPAPGERTGQDGMRKRESYRALILSAFCRQALFVVIGDVSTVPALRPLPDPATHPIRTKGAHK